MTFIADPVRMRFDDAEIAIVPKLKNAHMVDSADKLLVKSHKCPRRDSYCGLGREDFTPCADHCSAGSLPKITENMNKPTSGLFVNMAIFANKVIKFYPAFRGLYRMEEVIEQVVGTVEMFKNTTVWIGLRDSFKIIKSTGVSTTSKAFVQFQKGVGGFIGRAWSAPRRLP
ncbi:hypothetical protein [Burkholderia cepacia]|uniref:hypothetical protein n=1 Tax=Burkholderia cepacia TaxID=292 RepID=UPI00158C30F1|nr:hypothetical protein [Burkholderia cepacia]